MQIIDHACARRTVVVDLLGASTYFEYDSNDSIPRVSDAQGRGAVRR
jgi:hypothetical protein